jgi:hypothetical protein
MQNTNQGVNWDEYKQILFVDQSLEEIVKLNKAPDDPFIQAHQFVNGGKPAEARGILKQLLADPTAEVRTKLWAWNALRELGEKPPLNVANEIQGVVMEVPVDGWVDTLAAYSDGRARYVNGKSGAIVWEIPEETRISSLVGNFIQAAKPLVEKAPLFRKHQPAKSDVVRISLLTFGGIRIIEVNQSDLTERHIMSSTYHAGTQLFLALLDEDQKSKRNAK